jgi:hypothetical protein
MEMDKLGKSSTNLFFYPTQGSSLLNWVKPGGEVPLPFFAQ